MGLLTAHAERQRRDLGQRARQLRGEDGGAFVGLVIEFTFGLKIYLQLGDVSQRRSVRQVGSPGLRIDQPRLERQFELRDLLQSVQHRQSPTAGDGQPLH